MTENAPKTDDERIARFLQSTTMFLGPDPDIVRNFKLAPRSEDEERILSKPFDPQRYREILTVLQAACDETFDLARSTSASPAARARDLTTAFFTGAGDVTTSSSHGVAAFGTVLSFSVKFIRKYWEHDSSVGVTEGDAFTMNDARYGGVHNPDMNMMMPVYHEGRIVAWVCCAMHEGEIGARDPGGMGPSIESVWDEGLRLPPIKLASNYELKRDWLTFLQNSSREPQVMLTDARVRLGICMRLEERFKSVIETYGADDVIGALRYSLETVRDEVKRRIDAMPNGTARTTFYIDTTLRETALLKVQIALTIDGEKIVVDTTGSSPELGNRPINNVLVSTMTGFMMGIFNYTWPDLPKTPAVLDPFEFVSEPSTIVDASGDAPIALCLQPLFKMVNAPEICLSKLGFPLKDLPFNVKAPWYNQAAAFVYAGLTQHGNSVGNFCADLNGMGGGAKCDDDGEHAMAANFANMVDCGEGEHIEEEFPYATLISKRFETDAISFGKYRGGMGYVMAAARFGDQPFGFMTFIGGSKFPTTVGLYGGYGCPAYPLGKIRGARIFEVLRDEPDRFRTSFAYLFNERPFPDATYIVDQGSQLFEFATEGDLYLINQGAGGGYGDVLERDPTRVARDVEEEIISRETAWSVYRVAFLGETSTVDAEATEKGRADERRARVARSVEWEKLHADWVRPEPPEDVPYFGSWNGSKELWYTVAGQRAKGLAGTIPPILFPDPRDVKIAELTAELERLR